MDWLTATWPLEAAVVGMAVGAAVIAVSGWRLSDVVNRLADRTGIGEAMAGAVLLAAVTSLAGMIVTILSAASGNASLAISNSMGGIAVQVVFIVVADLVLPRVNIEHAAASLTNVFYSFFMLALLGIILVGLSAPDISFAGVHIVSPLILVAYVYGLRLARRVSTEPMWQPKQTRETMLDVPEEESQRGSLSGLWLRFVLFAAVIAVGGYVVGQSGLAIVEEGGLSGTVVGAFLTGVTTSLPELVTTVAAVRAGAPTLAIGGLVGGNTFDTLFVAAGDVAFREGPIYQAATQADAFVVAWTTLLAAVVGAGLVYRERRGIGFEGWAVLGIYVAGLFTSARL